MKRIIGMNDIKFLPVVAAYGDRFIYPSTKYTFVHSSTVMVTQTGLMVRNTGAFTDSWLWEIRV